MEVLASELAKVSSKALSTHAVQESTLDAYLAQLEALKASFAGSDVPDAANAIALHKSSNAALQDASKDYYNVLNKFNKSVDKKFTTDVKPLLPHVPNDADDPFHHMYFASGEAPQLMNQVIADYLTREGSVDLARVFAEEAGIPFPQQTFEAFQELHEIVGDMRHDKLDAALQWTQHNKRFLRTIGSPLEFHLHRSRFVSLLTCDTVPLSPDFGLPAALPGTPAPLGMLRGPALAIAYGRQHLSAFFPDHEAEISRLLSAALYMPLDRLLKTPFKDIFLPYPTLKVDPGTHLFLPQHIHSSHLIPLYIAAYCARNNLPREHGLKVITDVGGGGALSKLLKCITVTSAKKTTWESTTELPIELPPPLLDYRFHSVFSCPVSKEHAGCDEAATDGDEEMDGAAPEGNWPMMLPCGHVIARDTLDKLAKGGQRTVKCPYCPAQSTVFRALRVYF